jgi:hypothetical protein
MVMKELYRIEIGEVAEDIVEDLKQWSQLYNCKVELNSCFDNNVDDYFDYIVIYGEYTEFELGLLTGLI